MGLCMAENQTQFELTISKEGVSSTDTRFTMDNLGLGDGYKPLDAYFVNAKGDIVRRIRPKGERRITNKTLPRIAFQIYEKQIAALSEKEREDFPVCQYRPDLEMIRGIFPNVEEFKKRRKSLEVLTYWDNGYAFTIYSWNVFSTIYFVKKCIDLWGEQGDRFVLVYREKADPEKDADQESDAGQEENPQGDGYKNSYSSILLESKNLILRGAPGTGKSYLAKEIAADIVSKGYYDDYASLTDDQKKQVEFVQFHPSYDYSDFVEGLRPKKNDDGSIGFELKDGIFKQFVARARKNYEDCEISKDGKKSAEQEKKIAVREAMSNFFLELDLGVDKFKTIKGNEFYITHVDEDEDSINIVIPKNPTVKNLTLNLAEIRKMLESDKTFERITDITTFFEKKFATQAYSYDFALYKAIKAKANTTSKKATAHGGQSVKNELKKYIFVIDEINRGEISKIFGELFYSIDPGYRGRRGEISTQYANLHLNQDDKFYIPENVYIIGTMNDIDRSVDSFDFAMRRRFRFIEIKADRNLDMLDDLQNDERKQEAIRRMTALNNEIVKVEGLNENYQIGASYFLKLKNIDFDVLWTDYLRPLLQEYIQGMPNEEEVMKRFEKAYGYTQPSTTGDGSATTRN